MDKNSRGVIEVLIALAVAIWLMSRCHENTPVFKVKRDTVTITKTDTFWRDTVIEKPVHDTAYVVRKVKVPIPVTVHDTINSVDSVTLDIEQKVYRDSNYTAWVSGYLPQLDSILLHRKYIYTTVEKTITVTKKSPRLSLGLVGGYGYGFQSQRVEPFIGLGASYRLLP